MVSNAQQKLFFGLNKKLEGVHLGQILQSKTKAIIGIAIQPSLHRQFMAYLGNHHLERFPKKVGATMIAEQLGHSSEVDRVHYGLDRGLPLGTDYRGLRSCILTSAVYQQILGFGDELVEIVERETGVMSFLPPKPSGEYTQDREKQLEHAEIAAAVANHLRPMLSNNLQRSIQESMAAVYHAANPNGAREKAMYTVDEACVETHPILLTYLRQFLSDPHVGFRHHTQAAAAQLAASRAQSFLLVTPTGSGKTIPGLLAARYVDKGLVTVYIVPFVCMHEQLLGTFQRGNMTGESWRAGNFIDPRRPPQNVVVTCESAVMENFRQFLQELVALKKLARVIVDEAHLVLLHQKFREAMKYLDFLGKVGVQVILLTATLPVALENKLFDLLGMIVPVVIRTQTARPNISYRIFRVEQRKQVNGNVVSIVQELVKDKQTGRILVFCLSIADTEEIATALHVDACHARLGEGKVEEILGRYRSGAIQVIVSTCILGVGLDVPGVTHVIHAGNPRNIMEFSQESGRLGRDAATKRAFSIIVSSPVTSRVDEIEDDGEKSMVVYIQNERVCRRLPLQKALDGNALPCSMLGPETNLCDICEKRSGIHTSIRLEPIPSAPSMGLPTGPKDPAIAYVPNLGATQHVASTLAALSDVQSSIGSEVYRVVKQVLDVFQSPSRCILCHINRDEAAHSKGNPCPRQVSYKIFRDIYTSQLGNLQGHCRQCLLPQKISYTGVDGEKEYLHGFQAQGTSCQEADVAVRAAFGLVLIESDVICKTVVKATSVRLTEKYCQWLIKTEEGGEAINLLNIIRSAVERGQISLVCGKDFLERVHLLGCVAENMYLEEGEAQVHFKRGQDRQFPCPRCGVFAHSDPVKILDHYNVCTAVRKTEAVDQSSDGTLVNPGSDELVDMDDVFASIRVKEGGFGKNPLATPVRPSQVNTPASSSITPSNPLHSSTSSSGSTSSSSSSSSGRTSITSGTSAGKRKSDDEYALGVKVMEGIKRTKLATCLGVSSSGGCGSPVAGPSSTTRADRVPSLKFDTHQSDRPKVTGKYAPLWLKRRAASLAFTKDKARCLGCWLFRREWRDHELSRCTSLFGGDASGYKEFRGSIDIIRPGKKCYSCHFPLSFGVLDSDAGARVTIHGPAHVQTAGRGCPYADTVLCLPFLFLRYRHDPEFSDILHEFAKALNGRPGTLPDMDFTTVSDVEFEDWLLNPPDATHPPTCIMLDLLLETRPDPRSAVFGMLAEEEVEGDMWSAARR
ncbi:hypothetical protein NMY22_g14688 [Coprinellus aureogranulatus]|nr:hypothetical protein NMY22_g14688 [Coprinellus aureogranulatus]